jgi:hypothetical protein
MRLQKMTTQFFASLAILTIPAVMVCGFQVPLTAKMSKQIPMV